MALSLAIESSSCPSSQRYPTYQHPRRCWYHVPCVPAYRAEVSSSSLKITSICGISTFTFIFSRGNAFDYRHRYKSTPSDTDAKKEAFSFSHTPLRLSLLPFPSRNFLWPEFQCLRCPINSHFSRKETPTKKWVLDPIVLESPQLFKKTSILDSAGHLRQREEGHTPPMARAARTAEEFGKEGGEFPESESVEIGYQGIGKRECCCEDCWYVVGGGSVEGWRKVLMLRLCSWVSFRSLS